MNGKTKFNLCCLIVGLFLLGAVFFVPNAFALQIKNPNAGTSISNCSTVFCDLTDDLVYWANLQNIPDINGWIDSRERDTNWETGWATFDANMGSYYLKLDQSTPQTVSGGVPVFDGGIKLGDDISGNEGLNANQQTIFGVYTIRGTGVNDSANMDTRELYDSSGLTSLNWDARAAKRLNGTFSLDWGESRLQGNVNQSILHWTDNNVEVSTNVYSDGNFYQGGNVVCDKANSTGCSFGGNDTNAFTAGIQRSDNNWFNIDLNSYKANAQMALINPDTNYFGGCTRSTSNNHLTCSNQVIQAGGAGNAINYTGSSGMYTRIGSYNKFLDGNTANSITCWAYIRSTVEEYAPVCAMNINTPYHLFQTGGGVIGLNWQGVSATGGSGVNNNAWHFIAMTWASGEKISLWVDGVKTQSAGTLTGGITINDYFTIGYGNTHGFNGSIDQVAIWSRKLADSDIAEIYNSGTGITLTPNYTFATSGTSAGTNMEVLYLMDEVSGNPIDSSGKGRDGVNTGSPTYSTGKAPVNPSLQTPQWLDVYNDLSSVYKGKIDFGNTTSRVTLNGYDLNFIVGTPNIGAIDINTQGIINFNTQSKIKSNMTFLTNTKLYGGTSNQMSWYYDGTNGNWNCSEVGTGKCVILSDANIYKKDLYMDNNAFLATTATSRVGIGTTSPKNKLNVIGDLNATKNIYGNFVSSATDVNANRFCFTGGACATSWISSSIDTNWQTSWTTFDANLKAQYRKYSVDLNTVGNLGADGNYLCDATTCYKISDLNMVGGGGGGETLAQTLALGNTTDGNNIVFNTNGTVTSVSIVTGGTGYTVNDVLTLNGGTGGGNYDCNVTVTSVTDGVIDGISLTTGGTGYVKGQSGAGGGTGYGAGFSITIDGGVITDGTNTAIDPVNKILYGDNYGNVPLLDFSGRISKDAGLFFYQGSPTITPVLNVKPYNSGSAYDIKQLIYADIPYDQITFGWGLTGTSKITLSADTVEIPSNVMFGGTFLDGSGIASLSPANRMLSDEVGDTVFVWHDQDNYWSEWYQSFTMGSNNIGFSGGTINDVSTGFSGTVSIDPMNRYLASSNGAYSVDWGNNYLNDQSQVNSIDWNKRTLNAVDGSEVANWNTSEMFDMEDSTLAFGTTKDQYGYPLNGYIFGSNFGEDNHAIDFYAWNGTYRDQMLRLGEGLVNGNFVGGIHTTYPIYLGADLDTVNYNILMDGGSTITDGTNTSIDPYNRVLYASDGSDPVLNWNDGTANFGDSAITTTGTGDLGSSVEADAYTVGGTSGVTDTYDDGVDTVITFTSGIATGISTAYDARLMKEIVYSSDLNKETTLTPITFKWNDLGLTQFQDTNLRNSMRNKVLSGYTAQDVNKYYPSCVVPDTNLNKTTYYTYNRNCLMLEIQKNTAKVNDKTNKILDCIEKSSTLATLKQCASGVIK